MGEYPAFLGVLAAEVEREAAAIRADADRARAAALDGARRAAAVLRDERLARARAAAEDVLRAARDAASLEREREAFLARRLILDAVRERIRARLAAASRADPALLGRLLAEVLADAGEGPLTLVVDPGDEARCRALLAARPDLLARTAVEAAPAPRGGLALRAGRLELDATLPARLDRAWAALEPELARALFEEDGGCPASIA